MDEFLLTREHVEMSQEEIAHRLLQPLAYTLAKIHGTQVENGMVHGDLHPGNIYLLRPREIDDPFGIILLDWELCDHKLPMRRLQERTRKVELARFQEAAEKRHCKASLTEEEFATLTDIYNGIVEQKV